MSERFVSGVSAKIAQYKYSSFPFIFFMSFHAIASVGYVSALHTQLYFTKMVVQKIYI